MIKNGSRLKSFCLLALVLIVVFISLLRVIAISFNPETQDFLHVLLKRGGFSIFKHKQLIWDQGSKKAFYSINFLIELNTSTFFP